MQIISPHYNAVIEEYEQQVLGAILQSGKLIRTLENISVEDFYSYTHRKIYLTMCELEAEGIPINDLTVCTELAKKGQIDEIGGWANIGKLKTLCETTENIEYYIQKVKEAGILRRLKEQMQRMIASIEKESNTKEIHNYLKILQETFFNETETIPRPIILADKGEPPARSWLLTGAIPISYPTILYGEGGLGKSFVALYLAILACLGDQEFISLKFPKQPVNTLYLDWELEEDEVHKRLLMLTRAMSIKPPRNFIYQEMTDTLSASFTDIRYSIKYHNIGFVVLDSLGAACLNSKDELMVIETINKIKRLRVPTLLIDHQSKMQTGDTYDMKTAYGSVYKHNLSRSAFQLSIINKAHNTVTLMLKHKKSNFGPYLEDMVIDMIFEDNQIAFFKSKTLSPDEEKFFAIWEALGELEVKNASNLLSLIKGQMSRDTMFRYLKKGTDKYWSVLPGATKKAGAIYEPFPTFRNR